MIEECTNAVDGSLWKSRNVLLVVAGIATAAWLTDFILLKMAVPVSAAIIVAATRCDSRFPPWRVWLTAALLCSAAGDFFLSTRAGRVGMFIAGVVWYLVAHGAYAAALWSRGRPNLPVFLAAGMVVGGFVVWRLIPAIDENVVLITVAAYAGASVLSLAAAWGVRDGGRGRTSTAIVLIIASDTLIALDLFLGLDVPSWLILPTYYLAHIIFARDAQILDSAITADA